MANSVLNKSNVISENPADPSSYVIDDKIKRIGNKGLPVKLGNNIYRLVEVSYSPDLKNVIESYAIQTYDDNQGWIINSEYTPLKNLEAEIERLISNDTKFDVSTEPIAKIMPNRIELPINTQKENQQNIIDGCIYAFYTGYKKIYDIKLTRN